MSKENLVPDFDFELEVDSPVSNAQQDSAPDDKGVSDADDQYSYSKENDSENQPVFKLADDADQNIVAAYKFYRDRGYISKDYEDFDGKPESLEKILEKERESDFESAVNYLFESSPEFARPLIEIILNKGQEATKEEIAQLFELAQPSEFSIEDLKDEAKAEQFLMNYYQTVFEESKEDAEDRIDLLKDKGRLTKEAATLLAMDNERKGKILQQAVEESAVQRQAREQAEQNFYQDFVSTMSEANWRKDTVEKTAQEFYGGNFKTRLEHMLVNPKVLPMLVHFASHYDPRTGQINLDGFYKEAASPATRRKKENIQNYWSSTLGARGTSDEPDNGLDLSKYEIEI